MDQILTIVELDVENLRDHLTPEQLKSLSGLSLEFDIAFNNPKTGADTVKKLRDAIISLLKNYHNNENDQLSQLIQPHLTNDEELNVLISTLADNKEKFKQFEKDMEESTTKFNEHNKIEAYSFPNIDKHYRETQKNYNVIVGLRELGNTLHNSILQDERSLETMKLQGTSLDRKESVFRNNMAAITSFIEKFKIAYSNQKIQSSRQSKKTKKPGTKDANDIPITNGGGGGGDDDDIIIDTGNNDSDNVITKKPRKRGPNDAVPNPQLIGQAVDAEQCIYRKDARTLVKIIPAGSGDILLYVEMSDVVGFVDVEDTHTEDNFPVDRYELCPDMSKKEKYVLLEISDNLFNLQLNGNRNERFCIIYELLQSLRIAHGANGFRYNTKKTNTLKFKNISVDPRTYDGGRIKCTSGKRVMISDLTAATIDRSLAKSKGAELDATDVVLFENLIRQLDIPNFTHKLLGLLVPVKMTKSFIVNIDMETKKVVKKKKKSKAATEKNKKSNKKEKKKVTQYITFDKFIDAISDAWENQDFL